MRVRKKVGANVLVSYPGRRWRRSAPNSLRRLWRVPGLLLHLFVAYPLAVWTCRGKAAPDALSYRAFAWWSRQAMRILGLRLRVDGIVPAKPILVVGNHVSYLDILALSTLIPGRFVAKKEMRNWPFFGIMGVWLGTLFIDRGDVRASQRVIHDAAAILRNDTPVILFPEGTTSDGRGVGEFFAAPFEAAREAHVDTVPVALRYEDVLHPGQADQRCPFVGDDSLLGHLWRLTAAAPLTLRVEFLPALAPTLKRRELAGEAREAIAQALRRMEQGAPVTYLNPKPTHPIRAAWSAWRSRHGA